MTDGRYTHELYKLWPAKDTCGFNIGLFYNNKFIRISKYYNTETVMRKKLRELVKMSSDKLNCLIKQYIQGTQEPGDDTCQDA